MQLQAVQARELAHHSGGQPALGCSDRTDRKRERESAICAASTQAATTRPLFWQQQHHHLHHPPTRDGQVLQAVEAAEERGRQGALDFTRVQLQAEQVAQRLQPARGRRYAGQQVGGALSAW